MKDAKDISGNAKAGNIVPVIEEIGRALDPVEYFAKLSDYGRKKHSLLLESADIVPRYGEKSLGSADPCLRIEGRGEDFRIDALNETGGKFLKCLKGQLDFCDEVKYGDKCIKGKLKPKRKIAEEEERLKLHNHAEILRRVAFRFKPVEKPFIPYAGLFGMISYDFIDQFEDLPQTGDNDTKDADYIMYFLDNLFLIDHNENKTYFIANALITDENEDYHPKCAAKISLYKEAMERKPAKGKAKSKNHGGMESDTSKEEFMEKVRKIKGHILAGDVYQTVISRTISSKCTKEPLDIYRQLKKINPSPYMFYVNEGKGVLLGASPEMNLRVEGGKEKVVEIRPIAGTKPRGLAGGKMDADLDSRYETELKIDAKEISEHTMLVDLARNDVARICKPGTRYVDEPLVVEKYSHVQHLVSNVKGILKDDLDALHAYVATMNMGTLTGAPKVEAMKLIRRYESNKRGFYGGAIGYITPSKDMDSAIIIRSLRIKDGKAYVRVGAGIVHDSDPEEEYRETERKGAACMKVLGD